MYLSIYLSLHLSIYCSGSCSCSWSPTHRRPWCFKHFLAIFSFFDGLACQTSTQTSCYIMVVLGWGWVGWGGAMTFMSTCTHTHVMLRYCYVLLHLHTHVMLRYGDLLLHLLTHVMLRYGDLLLHLLTHVMLRYGDLLLHLHTHTRHAHHFFCRWKPCLGVTCQKFENQTCQSVSSKQRMDQTNAKNLLFFPVHCDRDANR